MSSDGSNEKPKVKLVGIGQGTPGPGRPKGSKNKNHKDRSTRVAEALAILNSGVTPLSIMWDMARGRRKFNPQILEACKAAAPYIHPKLVAVKMEASVTLSHEESLESLDEMDGLEEGIVRTGGSRALLMAAEGEMLDIGISEALEEEDEDE